MLPGIRFIFVTVILSASVLIFGLGAAALLRVSHEEFAALPSWRTAQPQFPPAPVETAPPTLAMLRIETPDPAKLDVTGESPDSAQPHSDADLKAQNTSAKPTMTTTVPLQPETPAASVEKSADMGDQPAPIPSDSPAPIAVTIAPAPTIEKQENGATEPAGSASKNSEAVTPKAQENPTKTVETKPDEAEATDTKVAEIKAAESKITEAKTSESDAPDVSVTAAITAVTNGHEIKLRTVKVHATKAKPVAKKKSRSGIYAVAQRRRAAARARAIARARAAQIAQQRLAAIDPLAALFGIPPQPAHYVQTQTPHQ